MNEILWPIKFDYDCTIINGKQVNWNLSNPNLFGLKEIFGLQRCSDYKGWLLGRSSEYEHVCDSISAVNPGLHLFNITNMQWFYNT
ncbi:hypothetical protein ACF0H5_019616 [Mactra antiquata]